MKKGTPEFTYATTTSSGCRKKRNQRKEVKKQCKQTEVKKESDLSHVIKITTAHTASTQPSSSLQILNRPSSAKWSNFSSLSTDKKEFPELGVHSKKGVLHEDSEKSQNSSNFVKHIFNNRGTGCQQIKQINTCVNKNRSKLTETTVKTVNTSSEYEEENLQHKHKEDAWHKVGRKGKVERVEYETDTEVLSLSVTESPKFILKYSEESTDKHWPALGSQKSTRSKQVSISTVTSYRHVSAEKTKADPNNEHDNNVHSDLAAGNSIQIHTVKGTNAWQKEENISDTKPEKKVIVKESSQIRQELEKIQKSIPRNTVTKTVFAENAALGQNKTENLSCEQLKQEKKVNIGNESSQRSQKLKKMQKNVPTNTVTKTVIAENTAVGQNKTENLSCKQLKQEKAVNIGKQSGQKSQELMKIQKDVPTNTVTKTVIAENTAVGQNKTENLSCEQLKQEKTVNIGKQSSQRSQELVKIQKNVPMNTVTKTVIAGNAAVGQNKTENLSCKQLKQEKTVNIGTQSSQKSQELMKIQKNVPTNTVTKTVIAENTAVEQNKTENLSCKQLKQEKKVNIGKQSSQTSQELKKIQENVPVCKITKIYVTEDTGVKRSKERNSTTNINERLFSKTDVKANQENQNETGFQSNVTEEILKHHSSVNTSEKHVGLANKSSDIFTQVDEGHILNSNIKESMVNEKHKHVHNESVKKNCKVNNQKSSVQTKTSSINSKSDRAKNKIKITEDKSVLDSNKKKRPKKNDIMEIDLLSMVQANKSIKQSAKKKTNKKLVKSDEKPVSQGNILDASNPVRHKGKVRLHKRKRISRLRSVILKERYMKHVNLVQAVIKSIIEEKTALCKSQGTSSHIELDKLIQYKAADTKLIENIFSNTFGVLPVKIDSLRCGTKTGQENSQCNFEDSYVNKENCFHNCQNNKTCLILNNNTLNEKTCTASKYDENKHFLLQETTDPITDLVKLWEKSSCSQDLDTSKISDISLREEDAVVNKSIAYEKSSGIVECELVHEKSQNTSVVYSETSVGKQYFKPKPPGIHSRKFKDYCDHCTNSDIDVAVKNLLIELVRLQTRAYQRNPVTALARRRYVLGFREVKKHLIDLKKVKLVIIAPDLEKIESEGGIYNYISNFKAAAYSLNVPCVFALGRSKLAYYTLKRHIVSCVGVLNYESCQELVSTLLNAVAAAREQYITLLKDHGYPIEQDIEECAEDFKHTEKNGKDDNKPEDLTSQVIQSFLSKLRDNDKTETNFSDQSALLNAIENNAFLNAIENNEDGNENESYVF